MKNKLLITFITAIITCLSLASIANQPNNKNNVDNPRNSTNDSSTLGNLPSDSAITTAIKTKYFNDNVLSGFDIHVKTINGVVTLSDTVVDNASKDRAISIAENTNDVKSVVSNLEVQHP